jgi:asparagine synthase (glutamine-hydrolysing)
MCGIAGIVSRSADSLAGEAVAAATQAMVHRGPDGVGFWRLADGRATLCTPLELAQPADIVLGHRPLSIVDLEGGAQPTRSSTCATDRSCSFATQSE